MQVVIIGTGNVATVLGKRMKEAGFEIVQVYGRDMAGASVLARALGSVACDSWSCISKDAGLYLVAISDDALYQLDQHLKLGKQIVVHTAGSVSKNVLQNISENFGVLYPLQSLHKEMPVLTEIPLLVDGNTEFSRRAIEKIARQLTPNVTFVKDEERLKLHVAAIYINNFTSHLYALTADFCKKEHLDFNLLIPLASETAQRMARVAPLKVITGPAVRKDMITINKHLDLLGAYPLFKKVYKQMTESIQNFDEVEDNTKPQTL